MATFNGLNDQIFFAHLDLTDHTNEIQFGNLSKVMVPCTTFADGGFMCVKPGLIKGDGSIKGYQDYATGVLDDQISVAQLGTQYAVTAIPNPTGTVTAADACWLSRGVLNKENPLSGAKGAMGGFEIGFGYDTAITQAKVAHPKAARTANGTGTAVALVGPTAAQKLYANLHVTAYSGFTNVVFTIESDDNGGFTTPATRITFNTVTGTTNQSASIVGDFSTETNHRIKWVVTGAGSITFAAAFGVI